MSERNGEALLLCYSLENVRRQAESAPQRLGFYELRFFSENGRPSRRETDSIDVFYYFPSGGTIRDRDMNIVFYEARLDMYHSSNRGESGEG